MARGRAAVAAGLFYAATSFAASDDDLVAAHTYYRLNDLQSLERYAQILKGHPLEDYALFWLLDVKLSRYKEGDATEIKQFLSRFGAFPLADKLRAGWLKLLGKNQEWDNFSAEYPKLVAEDLEITCYALQARLSVDAAQALKEARAIWFTGKSTPDSCAPLFFRLVDERILQTDDVWARLRLALEAGNTSLAHSVNAYLPLEQMLSEKQLDGAAASPQRYLEKNGVTPKSRAGRELAIFALSRLAHRDAQEAGRLWAELMPEFAGKDRGYVWGQLALQAALVHDPVAVEWFRKAKDAALTDQQLAWQVRAALRTQNWPDVISAIDKMSALEARESHWRYWKARACKAQNKTVEANALYLPLAREFNFYGLLAAEDMGALASSPRETFKADPDSVKALRNVPGIARALILNRLGLNQEGSREWIWAIRGFDDKQLLTAAETARQAEWYERSINTAEKTVNLHDFSLRYPIPYREALQAQAQQNRLDEAWVYGLVRQESRFLIDARSRSGAAGLMQLMPATAQWVARKIGLKDFHPSSVNQVDINATLGTFYLKQMLDDLGSPVVATAGYNAGPNRARRWRDEKPMEGAIFIESIPLNETRDYVKKVMYNTAMYSARLALPLRSLKQRLGTIAGEATARIRALSTEADSEAKE